MHDAVTDDWAPQQSVDGLRTEQQRRWLGGDRTPVEEYLTRHPGLSADDALDLIFGEYVLREGLGDKPDAADYLRRFPQYLDPLRSLFAVDRALLGDSRADPPEGTAAETGPRLHHSAPRPQMIGKYTVVALLGAGGQASVYRAVHPALGKEVVVKVSRNVIAAESNAEDRLQAEARILADLDHPNLARVYDLGIHDSRPFLVMEYIRGRNLEQYAAENKPSYVQSARLTGQVARGLSTAHQKGVLHLDIKPRNVVIDEAGRPRLIDFGLARLRDAWADAAPDQGAVSGTAAFMAPEQARGDNAQVGRRSDVFGLGGVLYALLTGAPPFRGADYGAALEAARACAWDRRRLETSGAPPRLRAICARALAANPDDRYGDAESMAADLESFARSAGRSPTRRVVLAGAFGLAGASAAVAVGAWRFGWFTQAAPMKVVSPLLNILVYRKGSFIPLGVAAPLKTGEELRLEIEQPAGMHTALFLLTSEGVLKELRQEAPALNARILRYPAGEEETTTLTGPPGTEFVLACGRRGAPISLEVMHAPWPEESAWPALPDDTVLRLDRERVWMAQGARDFGPSRTRPDAATEVRRRLEALRARLQDRFDILAGVAFAHRE